MNRINQYKLNRKLINQLKSNKRFTALQINLIIKRFFDNLIIIRYRKNIMNKFHKVKLVQWDYHGLNLRIRIKIIQNNKLLNIINNNNQSWQITIKPECSNNQWQWHIQWGCQYQWCLHQHITYIHYWTLDSTPLTWMHRLKNLIYFLHLSTLGLLVDGNPTWMKMVNQRWTTTMHLKCLYRTFQNMI